MNTIGPITQRSRRKIRISDTRLRACVNLCIRAYIYKYESTTMATHTPPHVVKRRPSCMLKNYFRREHCVYARTPDSAGNLCFTYVNILPRPTCVSRYLSNRQEFLSLREPVQHRLHRRSCYRFCQIPKRLLRKILPVVRRASFPLKEGCYSPRNLSIAQDEATVSYQRTYLCKFTFL